MKIYIDFDDCLCETARSFCRLAAKRFGKQVAYEELKDFNLQKSFSLTQEEYGQLMVEGHLPELLLSIEEVPGASQTVNRWLDEGHEVSIVTGRPFQAYESSRAWLDAHGLERVKLYCLDKYGRNSFIPDGEFSLELEDYYRMHFDVAIEDSPTAFRFFDHLPDLQVLVVDRPWNHECTLPGAHYQRCYNWEMIREAVEEKKKIQDPG